VYYEEGKLEERLNEILANYDAYRSVIENAYSRAINEYTTEKFVEKYLKNLK
jgi:glycosyltransferase involved in cell wall biosynthesis